MVVEKFTKTLINSGVFKLYIATGFFAILIFFVLNADNFTPTEMILGVILVTVGLKGICNMMLSLIVALFNLENKKSELEFKYTSEKINSLITELSVQEAQSSNNKK